MQDPNPYTFVCKGKYAQLSPMTATAQDAAKWLKTLIPEYPFRPAYTRSNLNTHKQTFVVDFDPDKAVLPSDGDSLLIQVSPLLL